MSHSQRMFLLRTMLKFLLLSCCFFYASISWAADQFLTPSQGKSGLFGYVNPAGNFVIKPQFEQASPFVNGIARVKTAGLWRLINEKGKFISKGRYESIGDFRNGLAMVAQNYPGATRHYGLIDAKGGEVVAAQYEYLTAGPNYDLFIAGKHQKTDRIQFGVIDREGKAVVPVRFRAIRDWNFRAFAVQNDEQNWQVFSRQGTPLFVGTYTEIKDFDEDLATIRQGNQWGVMDRTGKTVIKVGYRDIIKRETNTYNLLAFPQWKVIDGQKKTRFSGEFEQIKPVHEYLYSYLSEGKTGLLDSLGKRLTQPLFDEMYPFAGKLSVVRNDSVYGVINTKGVVVLPVQYRAIRLDTTCSLIATQHTETGKWGVFNRAGKAVTPAKYDEIRIQAFSLMTVRQSSLWFLLDASGHVIGDASFESVADFTGLYTTVRQRGKAGLINIKGNWSIEPTYDSLRIVGPQVVQYYTHPHTGLINIHTKNVLLKADALLPLGKRYFITIDSGKTGVCNSLGVPVVPASYDFISTCTRDSIVTVQLAGKLGLISLSGKMLLRPSTRFQEMHVMQEERVGVKINNKYGFVDRDGKLRIANRYEGVAPFSDGMAAVMLRGRWGFVDKVEALRVQPIYTQVQPFHGGAAAVKKESKWGFVNKQGRETIKPQYDQVQLLPTGRYVVEKDGRKGLVSESGRELYPPKYERITDVGNGLVILNRNGKAGLADTGGYDVTPIIYDQVYVSPSAKNFILGIIPPAQKFVITR